MRRNKLLTLKESYINKTLILMSFNYMGNFLKIFCEVNHLFIIQLLSYFFVIFFNNIFYLF